MPYLTTEQIKNMGFKSVGKAVKISDRASIYNTEQIQIGDFSRIDDFCVISGRVIIGKNVHIAPFCLIAGGEKGIELADFSGLAYQVKVFSQSDDYSGASLTNPTIPDRFKNEIKKKVVINRHCIVGAGSMVMPGVVLGEGTAIGAMSLVRKKTEPWTIYLGNPAIRIKARKKDLLLLERQYLDEVDE